MLCLSVRVTFIFLNFVYDIILLVEDMTGNLLIVRALPDTLGKYYNMRCSHNTTRSPIITSCSMKCQGLDVHVLTERKQTGRNCM